MQTTDFVPLNSGNANVRAFDCGKDAINTYLRRFAAKNMALNLNRTYVLPAANNTSAVKPDVAAFYTLAQQTLLREDLPDPSGLPRYAIPVILLAQLGVDRRFAGKGLGSKTLVHALRHAYRIATNPIGLPATGLVLDAIDEEALGFYRQFDFFLPLTEKPMRLFVPMKSLESL